MSSKSFFGPRRLIIGWLEPLCSVVVQNSNDRPAFPLYFERFEESNGTVNFYFCLDLGEHMASQIDYMLKT